MSERQRSYLSLSRSANGYTHSLLARSEADKDNKDEPSEHHGKKHDDEGKSVPNRSIRVARDPQTLNVVAVMPAEVRGNAEPVGGGSLVRKQIQRLYGKDEEEGEKKSNNGYFVKSLNANSSRQMSTHHVRSNGDKGENDGRVRTMTTRTSVLNSSVVSTNANNNNKSSSSSVPAVFRLLRPAFREQLKTNSALVPLDNKSEKKEVVADRSIPIVVESRDTVDFKLKEVLVTQRQTELSPKRPMTNRTEPIVIPIERTYGTNHTNGSLPKTTKSNNEEVVGGNGICSTSSDTEPNVLTTTSTVDDSNVTPLKIENEAKNMTVNMTNSSESAVESTEDPLISANDESNGHLLTTIVEEGSEVSEQDLLNKTKSSEEGFDEETKDDTKIDGHYFIKLIENETFKFEEQILEFEEDLTQSDLSHDDPKRIPDEARDNILATVGKAKLLMAQKMAQFRGLCDKNIGSSDASDPFVPTSDDLAGFWDMVSLQVADIHAGFANLRSQRERGWIKEEEINTPAPKRSAEVSQRRRVVKGGRGPVKKVQSEASKARDEARRKMLEEKKRLLKATRMASNTKNNNSSEEIFVQF